MDIKIKAKVLGHDELTEGEHYIYRWQFGLLSDFYKTLIEAICIADHINLARLELGFPEIVRAYRDFSTGDLASKFDRLEESVAIELGLYRREDAVHEENREAKDG